MDMFEFKFCKCIEEFEKIAMKDDGYLALLKKKKSFESEVYNYEHFNVISILSSLIAVFSLIATLGKNNVYILAILVLYVVLSFGFILLMIRHFNYKQNYYKRCVLAIEFIIEKYGLSMNNQKAEIKAIEEAEKKADSFGYNEYYIKIKRILP